VANWYTLKRAKKSGPAGVMLVANRYRAGGASRIALIRKCSCGEGDHVSDWYSPWQPGRIAGLARYDTFLASPRLHEPAFGAAGGTLMLPSRDNGLKHTPDEFVPLDPAQILVAMLLPIGDTLLATPALAALRRRFPLAKITVVAGRSNAGILTDNPAFDQLVIVDEPGPHRRVVRVARRLSQLRQVKYDLVINLSPVSSLVLMMAGIYQRTLHVEMPLLWWLIGGHSDRYRARHAVDHYLHAISPILDQPLSEEERQPRVYLTARDRSAARRRLREWGLSPADLIITMHVGGEGFNGRKRWAPQRFAEVANHLIERFNAHVLLVGGADDLALCEAVAAYVPRNVTVAAGKTSLKETAALIEVSALFVGNDSCPLHIAAAVNTPAVGIFGPSNWEQFRPIGKRGYRQRVVHSDLACSPCFHFVGNDAPWVPNTCYTRACLKAIAPEQVLDAAVELLQDQHDA
jgi:lipopolysaccharide heptosyltransferase II